MYTRTFGRFLLAAIIVAAPAAQTPAKVDFARDVPPMSRERCSGCAWPDQRMRGVWLGRGGAARRGGSQWVCGPGTGEGSRLYPRLIGTQFGTRMPPAGALPADQIAII